MGILSAGAFKTKRLRDFHFIKQPQSLLISFWGFKEKISLFNLNLNEKLHMIWKC